MIKCIRNQFNRVTQSILVGLTVSMVMGIMTPINAAEKVVFTMNTKTVSLENYFQELTQELEQHGIPINLDSLNNSALVGDYEIEVADLEKLARGENHSQELKDYFKNVEDWQIYLKNEIKNRIKNATGWSDSDVSSIALPIQNTIDEKLSDFSLKAQEQLNRSISTQNPKNLDSTFLAQMMNVSDLERQEFRGLMTKFKDVNTIKFLQDFPEPIITRDNFLNCLKTCNFKNENNSRNDNDNDNNNNQDNEKLNVLWYGQGEKYDNKIAALAGFASEHDPSGDGGFDWNLTIWNPLDAAPTFSDYDVFVIGSAFRIPFHGFNFDETGLFNSKKAIEKARGERTVLMGLDADAHYMLPRAGQNPDNPKNFLINAVNWAGNGAGLGIVSLPDGIGGSRWWLDENSFLKDELADYLTYVNREDIGILDEMLDFPIHEGLTAADLSNWHKSNHVQFAGDLPDYCSVNHLANNPEKSTTVMSGNCNQTIPESSVTLGLLTLGLMSFGSFIKRQKV